MGHLFQRLSELSNQPIKCDSVGWTGLIIQETVSKIIEPPWSEEGKRCVGRIFVRFQVD
jgi:hypothetical protein